MKFPRVNLGDYTKDTMEQIPFLNRFIPDGKKIEDWLGGNPLEVSKINEYMKDCKDWIPVVAGDICTHTQINQILEYAEKIEK